MQKCVHVIKVLTATKDDDQVSFLAMAPVLDSVLSTYISTNPSGRATMLGYKQVENMISKGNAVEGKTPDGDNIIIGQLYRDEDSDLTNDEVRSIVSKSVGNVDLSPIDVEEGVPGQDGNSSCVSVAGAVCISYEVRRGYTTFYVRGEDTGLDEDFRRRYAVVNWRDDSELLVVDAETGEFVDLITDTGAFGRHVENAYKVSMAEDIEVKVKSPKIAKKTLYLAEDEEEDIDVENLTEDPADVAGKTLGLVSENADDYENVLQSKVEEGVEGEGMAALAGARDKGFLKEGGTVMMPEHEEKVSVIEIESLFD